MTEMKPPLMGREAKGTHAIVLHNLRLMSLFPNWIDSFPHTYNLSWVKDVLANTRSLDDIDKWGNSEWGLWYSLMTKWRSFAKTRAGF